MSLQFLEWREVGLNLSWPVISYKPHPCDQYLCCQNANVDSFTPLVPLASNFSPLIKQGHSRKCWEGQHRASCSPNLEGVSAACCWDGSRHSTLYGTFSVWLKFVPLGQWWHTLPTQLALLCKDECTLQEWWEEVGLHGGLVSILSAGSLWGMRGCNQQPAIPLHIVPPPTSPSLSPPLVSFSQDKAACFQRNGITLSVIVYASISQP